MTLNRLSVVAADSNVLLSAVIGKTALRVFTSHLVVMTTRFNFEEVMEYIPPMAAKYRLAENLLILQLKMLPMIICDKPDYEGHIKQAEKYLKDRDPDDVYLGALALKKEMPIWTNDKDFENLPVAIYSTAKLLKILETAHS